MTQTVAPTDFDTVADVYDESLPHHVVEHYLRKRLAYVRRNATTGPVLDVGCGTGVLLERVVDAGYEAVGLDPSRGMLTQLRARRPEIPTVVGDGAALPFPDETFALVYCVAVLHHVAEATAVRQTLAEMSRVTRRGGRVLIWDHNPANPYWPWLMRRVPQDTGGERLIPTDEIVAGLNAGGARPIACQQLGLVPDFTPRRLLGAAQVAERLTEATPGVRRLCAHNVILAVKDGNVQS
ncbi:MAG: class I SAM-dependent methyltransferase [Thermomicrobiales bacterium]